MNARKTPARRSGGRRCAVCGLDPAKYPDHKVNHVGRRLSIDAGRVAQVEAENLALRDALGLPPGGGAR